MGNPFDDDDVRFYVLVDEEGQHSLWPVFAAIPSGWTIAHGPRMREQCLEFVAARRPDPHPAAILEAMRLEAN